ncbi:peptidase S10, serine carboxypeptidase, partial [Martensiomyces pterosporus]
SAPVLCDPRVQQYSGYIDVAADKHLFYWFFEARNRPPNSRQRAPLILWLNGGPGCSSMSGLLAGIGPCRVSEDGHGTAPNPYSWNTNAHVLFVDQPTGVGFSYGANVTTTAEAARDMYDFLHRFYEKFPLYQQSDLHVTGESYAAHYIPGIALEIINRNNRGGRRRLPLAGIGVGNGLFDMKTQYKYLRKMACNSTYPSLVEHRTCDAMDRAYVDFAKSLQVDSLRQTSESAANATFAGYSILVPYQSAGGDPYDVRKKCQGGSMCDPYMKRIATYVNQPNVRLELGVRINTDFALCSKQVQKAFIDSGDQLVDTSAWIPQVLGAGVRVLVYAGDADLVCNWMGVKASMLDMSWPGRQGFSQAKDAEWTVQESRAGEVRRFDNLTFVRVYGAGHFVPYDQPANSLDMVSRWL